MPQRKEPASHRQLHLGTNELHMVNLLDAKSELSELLTRLNEVPLGRVDDMASKHGVKATELLHVVYLLGDCEVDLGVGVYRPSAIMGHGKGQ